MLVVALTGGIGAGKSLVAQYFSELGARVVDADQLSRVAIERGSEGFDEVITRFGVVLEDRGSQLFKRTVRRFHVFRAEPKRAFCHHIAGNAFSDEIIDRGLIVRGGVRRRRRIWEIILDPERVVHAIAAAEDATLAVQHYEHIIRL